MPHRKYFGNDPAFGKHKRFDGQSYQGKGSRTPISPTATESQYTAGPDYAKGLSKDPYQGAKSLVTDADFYSNPNMDEHVTKWPTKKIEENQDKQMNTIIIVGGIVLFTFIILKLASTTTIYGGEYETLRTNRARYF